MKHIINKNERQYGYIIEESVLNGYGTDHQFDGVKLITVEGTKLFGENSKGQKYHTHSSMLGRLDGLTQVYYELSGDAIDISVCSNIVIIKELEKVHTDKEAALQAAELRALLETKN